MLLARYEHERAPQVILTLDLNESDPLYKVKLRSVGNFKGAGKKKFQIPVDYKEKITKEAFSYARFLVADVSCALLCRC